MRCVGSVYPAVLKAAGAVPVTMPSGEAYDALSKGVVQGTLGAPETTNKYKWYETCKNWTRLANLYGFMISYGLTVNLDVWGKLPADAKKVMVDVGNELTKQYPVWLTEAEKTWQKGFENAGMKFYDLPVAEQEALKAKVARTAYENYVKLVEGLGYSNARKIAG